MEYKKLLDEVRGSGLCPFCAIDHKEIILENNTAFLVCAIAPYGKDHLLICSKRHVEHVIDLDEEEFKDISSLERKGIELINKLGYKSFSYMVRDGNEVGKTVSHLHYHLIPNIILRPVGDAGSLDRSIMTEKEIEESVNKFKSLL